jgi:DNA invertase Pin-like site-specific DNA recombinase
MIDPIRKIAKSFLHEYGWEEKQKKERNYYYFILNMLMQFLYSWVCVDDKRVDIMELSEEMVLKVVDMLAEEMSTFHREYRKAYSQIKRDGYAHNPPTSDKDSLLLEIADLLPEYK